MPPFRFQIIGFIVALTTSAWANNGSIAVSATTDEILIDGQFSDWPAPTRWHTIDKAQYGDEPSSEVDCQARFSVAFDDETSHLFVAVEVRDDSVIGASGASWDTQDACTIYLATNHGKKGTSRDAISISGQKLPKNANVESAFRRTDDTHYYEFAIALDSQPLPYTSAFEVQIVDRDTDGSLTVIDWGYESFKMVDPDRLGDLIVPAGNSPFGSVLTSITTQGSSSSLGPLLVRYESSDNPNLVADILTDSKGRHEVALPSGTYTRYIKNLPPGTNAEATIEVPRNQTLHDRIDLSQLSHQTAPLGKSRAVPLGAGSTSKDVRIYCPADGIPNGDIHGLATDSHGRLWIGSVSDIAYLDGDQLHYYSEHPFLRGVETNCLLYDRELDSIWIGCNRGLRRIDLRSAEVTEFGTLSATNVSALHSDDKTLWIGTHGGLFSLCKESKEIKRHGESGSDDVGRILSVATDTGTGGQWIGSELGLFRYDGAAFTRLSHSPEVANGRIWSLLSEPDGAVLAATATKLYRVDSSGGEELAHATKDERHRWIRSIARNRHGEILLSVQDGLLNLGISAKLFYGEETTFIHEDPDGTLWGGSWNSLIRFERNLSLVDTRPVRRVSESESGKIFYTYEADGSWFLRGGRPDAWSDFSLGSMKPICLLIESDSSALIGTEAGVIRVHGGTASVFVEAPWPQERVQELKKDSGGYWALTDTSLIRIEDNVHKTYEMGGDLPPSCNEIAVDGRGRVALASLFGAAILENGTVTRLTQAEGLIHDMVTSVLFDPTGGLWIGTYGGLQHWDGTKFKSYTVEDGLTHKKVHDLAFDASGHLWVTGPYGLARFDGQIFQTSTAADGPAFRKVDDLTPVGDEVWLSSSEGLYRHRRSEFPPSISLTEVVSDKVASDLTSIQIDTLQEHLSIGFDAVSLKTRANGIVYRYRLNGVESDWTTSRTPTISYGALPKGTHTFQVQAIDRDLNYSKILEVPIHVEWPVKRLATIAAIAVLSLALLGITFLYLRKNRVAKRTLKARVRERTADLEANSKKLEDAQDQLRQSQKMEAVGTLAGGIAHDFNNLLTGITGNLAVAKLDPSGSAEHISAAESAAQRASELVKQLLGFSRNTEMKFQVSDVNKVIEELRRLLRHGFDSSVEFAFDLAEDIPPVKIDPTQIEQVLLNLCVNARDAMSGSGKIWITTREIGDQIEISVKDNGSGMPKEVREKIFEPFFTTKEQGKGTGLGLAMSYGILQQHDGEIICTSEPGVGTTFRMLLQAEGRSERPVVEKPEPTIQDCRDLGGTETILVVDDESVVRTVASGLLRRSGYNVETADCGVEALEILERRAGEIHAVLLDVTMPGMSGKEVLSLIDSRYPGLPVIICSGYLLDPEELRQETGARPAETIQKPYELRHLLSTVRDVLEPDSALALSA